MNYDEWKNMLIYFMIYIDEYTVIPILQYNTNTKNEN